VQATANSQSPMQWVTSSLGVPQEFAFTQRVQLAKDSTEPLPAGATNSVAAPFVSSTGELTFDPANKLVHINAPTAAGVIGTIGAGSMVTSGPIDLQLAPAAQGFSSVLVTTLDNRQVDSSRRLLITVPGYARRALPAPGDQAPDAASAAPQDLVAYLNATGWWTIDPKNAIPTWGSWVGKTPPAGNMGSGYAPTFMERVECWLTLRTNSTSISVAPLDGAGNPAGALPDSEVQAVAGGYRIHLNGDGQTMAPWFAVTSEQPVLRGQPTAGRPARRQPR